MKLSSKQAYFLSNILASILMTIVMTGGMLMFHSGYCLNFYNLWLNDFLIGCCIAVPTGLIIVPLITKWVNLNTK